MTNIDGSSDVKPPKVLTIVGTRPEIIRLSRIVPKLDEYFDHRLVHTGQNYDYELNQVFFEDLGIRSPDIFLECDTGTAAKVMASVIAKVDEVYEEIQPDAILILGDTNSSIAALPAKRRQIPIFHMEAGNRSFDMRVPEEINRRVVDHLADINLPYSEIARQYLIREGIAPDMIVRTGSPMREILQHYSSEIEKSEVLEREKLEPNEYFLVSVHRQENVDSPVNLDKFLRLLKGLSERYQLPVVVSTHPRTRKRLEAIKSLDMPTEVKFMRPFGFFDYIKLQVASRAVLSDSGTITEEASILNFPAINLRDSHERPEGMEEASVMFTGMSLKRVLVALTILQGQSRGEKRTMDLVADYTPSNVSEKVVRVIISHLDFVAERVWRQRP